jgi:hypothetical protein
MNERATQSTEFVLKRLEDGFRFFGREYPGSAWGVAGFLVLALALVVAFWFYLRERKTLGLPKVLFLFGLRATTYFVLAWIFLLPAMQTWEESTLRSRVLVAFDVSRSMTNSIDALPDGKTPIDKLPRRQDRVLGLLETGDWIMDLAKENPLEIHRFARGLVAPALRLQGGKIGTTDDWKAIEGEEASKDLGPVEYVPLKEKLWPIWLKPGNTPPIAGESRDIKWLSGLDEAGKKAAVQGEDKGTSLIGSLLGVTSAAAGSMVRGLVVISDGRSTEESAAALGLLREQARVANIPVIVVGVGEDRPLIRTEVVDLRAPGQVQPDDIFRVAVDVTGEGLAGQAVPDPILEIRHLRKLPGGKVEEREIELAQSSDPSAKFALGKLIRIKLPALSFDASTPSRATLETILDAPTLSKAAGKEPPAGVGKWVLAETGDGNLAFTAVVGRDRRELSALSFASRGPVSLRVQKKPLRVLLMAGAASREFQFVRNMFVREMEKKRAEVSIYLQLPPGALSKRNLLVQDVPPERMLEIFPDRYDTDSPDPALRLRDLASYDAILAFDPDWSQLSDPQRTLLNTFVDKGGGLVIVSGPVNSLQLAKPGAERTSLKSILDLYPVLLRDLRLDGGDRNLDNPWPLRFEGATPEMEFLRLDEEESKPFLADWAEFFNSAGKPGESPRGFYSTYPIEEIRKGAIIAARLGDERLKQKDGKLAPWMVLSDPQGGRRVVWIGSDESWRLRQFKETWHERFWTKLARYAAANSQGRDVRRIRLFAGGPYQALRPISFEAVIDDRGGKPLANVTDVPRVKLIAPQGISEGDYPATVKMEPRPGSPGVWRARFQVRAPARYEMIIEVPSTRDKLTGNSLIVEASDPEAENTRPDWTGLYELASPISTIESRLSEEQVRQVREAVRRPGGPAKGDVAKATGSVGTNSANEPRLLFDIPSAGLIPSLLPGETSSVRNRGPVDDVWDDGPSLGSPSGDNPGERVLPWAMLAIVVLLSTEWTLRKLWKVA